MRKNKLILESKYIVEILGKEYNGLSEIFSDKFGIVNAILKRNELSKYHIYMYQCLSANAKDLYSLDREVSSGGLGVHFNEKYALIGCLAEAIERYCISYIPKNDVIYCKRKDLDQNRVFDHYYLYSPEQYNKLSNFANPLEDSIHWTKIQSIHSKKWKYWPASLIYIPFSISKPACETTTTGTAAGFTIKDCIENGLLELIERDALMINFMQKLDPPEIDLNTITSKKLNELVKMIHKEYNMKIYQLYTDTDVPVMFSIIWKKRFGRIHYGIGACASLDSDTSIYKSLKECLFTYFYSKHILDLRKTDPNEIDKLYEHFLFYQRENFDKLLFHSKIIKYKRKIVKFNDIIDKLRSSGVDAYYKEITTPDVKNTNIKVVKVIAPGLIDLNKSHVLPRLNANRFWDVPRKLGLSVNDTLRDEPHPFP